MISQTTAQSIVYYLVSAGLLTATENQGLIWADFLNSSEAGIQWANDRDFTTAVRKLVAESDGKTRVTAGSVAKMVKRIGAERLSKTSHPVDAPETPEKYLPWYKHWANAVMAGKPPSQAVEDAWGAICETVPKRIQGIKTKSPESSTHVDMEKIRKNLGLPEGTIIA